MEKLYLCILNALSDGTRLRIISLLKNEDKLKVGELCLKLNLEQTRLSHALKCLKNCGIVESEIDGRYRFYSLNKKFTGNLFKVLDLHLKEYGNEILKCEILKESNNNGNNNNLLKSIKSKK